MQPRNHARRFEGILKMKSQAFKAPDPESLQSKFPFARKIESPIKALRVLRGRLARTGGALDQPGRMLCLFALYGVDPGLGALLILVGRTAADANPTDLHLVCGHDGKAPGKRDDARKIGYAGHHAGLALLAEGDLDELARREGKLGRGS
jgi:hypothetical protein